MQEPFNILQWIEDNKNALQPPVCNKVLYPNADFIVMVVGGPNTRKDYHYDEGPEFFYQLHGDMLLKTVQQGRVIDIPICEGEIFLLPAKIPHSPQRFEDTVGLVIERKRLKNEKDGLLWYCDTCCHLLYEEYFVLKDIERDFQAVFDNFYLSNKNRTCQACGDIMPLPKYFKGDGNAKG